MICGHVIWADNQINLITIPKQNPAWISKLDSRSGMLEVHAWSPFLGLNHEIFFLWVNLHLGKTNVYSLVVSQFYIRFLLADVL